MFNDYDTVQDTLASDQQAKVKAEQSANAGKPSISQENLENLEMFNDYDAVRVSQAQAKRDRRQDSASENHIQSPQINMDILADDYALVGQTHDFTVEKV